MDIPNKLATEYVLTQITFSIIWTAFAKMIENLGKGNRTMYMYCAQCCLVRETSNQIIT